MIIEGNHPVVYFGSHHTVTNCRMYHVGKINWSGTLRKSDDVASGGEAIDLLGENIQIALYSVQEFTVVLNILLPLKDLAQP